MRVLNDIDARIAELWPALVAAQEQYRADTGCYFQLLPTHSVPPADGQIVRPDRLNRKPSDRLHTPKQIGFDDLVGGMACSAQVDVYGGPHGLGWVLHLTLTIAGTTWRRSIQHGPDGWRDTEWETIDG